MKIIEIKKDNIGKKAISFRWDDRSTDFIEKLSQKWLDGNHAESILLFFKADGKKLHAFMIINPKDKKQIPSIRGLQSEKDELNIIEAKSYPMEGSSLSKDDKNNIEIIMKEKNLWSGGEAFRVSNQSEIQDREKLDILMTPHSYHARSFTIEHSSYHLFGDVSTSKKTVVKKSGAKKKAGSIKTGAKKKTTKKSGAKKVASKKTGAKKVAVKKSTKKKATTKKPVAKKSATKKSKAKKTTAKKPATKKTAKAMHSGFAFGR